MITLLVVTIINGLIWFVLGYKFGKDSGQYLDESDLMEKKAQREDSLQFKFNRSANETTLKRFSHE